jgi:hypothetical protein
VTDANGQPEKTEIEQVERLAALVDAKLTELEGREDSPSLAELNAARRLVQWVEMARARQVTTLR